MIDRRRFLAASAAGALAGGLATASPTFARSAARVSIGETFAPAEWRTAFEALISSSGEAADLAFWRNFPIGPGTPPAADEFHLLALPAPGVEPFSPRLASRLAAISNDRLSEAVNASGGVLGGLASISAFDPRAAQEAERAITQLKLSGLALGANRGMRLSHRELWPVYDFAQSARVPIYLPAAYSAGAGVAPYRSLQREGVIAGAASDSASHASQLIFGGVLDEFPHLTFILGRLGEATPYWYREITLAEAGASDDAWVPRRDVKDYFRTNIYLTTADMVSPATVEFCTTVLGKERVLRSGYGLSV